MIKQKTSMKNKRMMKILYELIKNSNRSDHKLSKVIGISQPTVTRLRNQLEKEGYIQAFERHFLECSIIGVNNKKEIKNEAQDLDFN